MTRPGGAPPAGRNQNNGPPGSAPWLGEPVDPIFFGSGYFTKLRPAGRCGRPIVTRRRTDADLRVCMQRLRTNFRDSYHLQQQRRSAGLPPLPKPQNQKNHLGRQLPEHLGDAAAESGTLRLRLQVRFFLSCLTRAPCEPVSVHPGRYSSLADFLGLNSNTRSFFLRRLCCFLAISSR